MNQAEHVWRQLPADVTVRFAELDDVCGLLDLHARTITLDARLTQRERRVTLLHELVHLRRGDTGECASPWHLDKQELVVEDETAQLLMPLDALVVALRVTDNEWDLADELWVDVALVRHRLARLTPGEKEELDRRLWDEWRSA